MSRGSGMSPTRRHSRNPVAAISDAERAVMEQNYYHELESWLGASEDTGYPEPPAALMRPTKRKKR